MKTYTGTVVRASHDTQTPNVTVLMAVQEPRGRDLTQTITLHCGTRIAAEASCLIGRRVQFQAELSERTQCLTNIQLCVRSEFGLRAVRADTREQPLPFEPGSVHAYGPPGNRTTPGFW